MSNSRAADFHNLVWTAVAKVGGNAGRVTDEILKEAYPLTANAAKGEGADVALRAGVLKLTREVLKSAAGSDGQGDFSSISNSFKPLVETLGNRAYFVESLDEHVPVARLIASPKLLDEARRYMRRKGMENLAEAAKLDDLYEAVIAAAPKSEAA